MKRCLALVLSLTASTAHAEAPEREKTVLVQTIIAEAGYQQLDDHAAMLHVLERRRALPVFRGHSLAKMALSYSSFWKRRALNGWQRAIRAITWESAPMWARDLVDAFLAGDVPDPCSGAAWHWGTVEDAAKRPTWTRVRCGRTHNVFLTDRARPRRVAILEPLSVM